MENLKTLLKNNDHEKILELTSPEFDKYKAIAALHLEKYREALVFASKNSFEMAYAYYKLKMFKKSLKILRKLNGKAADVLKSQCLYFLGYYSEAYGLLSQYGDSDEYAVNLSAMEVLSHLYTKNRFKPSLFGSKDEETICQLVKCKFTNPECLLECEYNAAFRNVEDEKRYVEELRILDQKYNIENSCIQKQIKNLTSEEISNMAKGEQEIASFNFGKISGIANPVLFQQNFLPDRSSDVRIFKSYKNNKQDFIKGLKKIEPWNDKLRILKGLVLANRRCSDSRNTAILKVISHCQDCIEKEILELLCLCDDKEFQRKALQLILKANK